MFAYPGQARRSPGAARVGASNSRRLLLKLSSASHGSRVDWILPGRCVAPQPGHTEPRIMDFPPAGAPVLIGGR
jgi:hypothetical protein